MRRTPWLRTKLLDNGVGVPVNTNTAEDLRERADPDVGNLRRIELPDGVSPVAIVAVVPVLVGCFFRRRM